MPTPAAAAPPIALEEYAFVTAGRADGLPLADLLEYRRIDGAEEVERP